MTTDVQAHTDIIAETVATEGWFVTQPVLRAAEVDLLLSAITPYAAAMNSRGGARNLFELPEIRSLACTSTVRDVAEAILGPRCMAVKATLFDKTPAANWKVVWHQDVTIAVRERVEAAGYGPWSEKDGTLHVQPPAHVLQEMVAIRVHLDDCGADNGPVRVIPRSHRDGRLTAGQIDTWRSREDSNDCLVERGGILVFRPLLLHASSQSTAPRHRRVVHFEFAARPLSDGLHWAMEVDATPSNRMAPT